MIKYSLYTLFLCFSIILKAQIYVDPNGNDSNPGTIDSPLLTITKAITSIAKGDTIFIRGGSYNMTSTVSIGSSKSGDENTKCYMFAYEGERPLLDFSSMAVNSSNRGINMKASWWYIKGLDIKGAGDNGMNLSGSNNIIEYCSFYENHDTGLQIGSGGAYNKIINCDSYFNADPGQGNADGFAAKLDVGTGNYFYGCRSWQNSDDGWDGYLRGTDDVTTTLVNCWTFKNGYLKNGTQSKGNGNGFKMGGSDDKTLMHNFILKNCLAFDNLVKGFDQNNNKGSMTLFNCSAYNNGTNYGIGQSINTDKEITIKNSLAFGDYGSIYSSAIQTNNSWDGSFTVTADDFVSIDPSEAYGSRKEDGSLPDINFMHLVNNSDLIDGGVDVGIAFTGKAPDLGAFEYGVISSVELDNIIPNQFELSQNFPNPFNPSTSISYYLSKSSNVKLIIYSLLGQEVETLVNNEQNAGSYKVNFNAGNFSSGVYIYRLFTNNTVITKKMVLLK